MKIPLTKIMPDPDQPRKNFSQRELSELAESIRINGLMNAVAVEECEEGNYILIDGERRYRACLLLGLHEIEATVIPAGEDRSRDRFIRAMVANLQRVDLSPVEEGNAYKRMRDMGMSYTAIAHYTGVCHLTVTSRLKMLELEPEVQDLIGAGKLPIMPLAIEALLSIHKPQDQVKMALRLAHPGVRLKTIEQACWQYNQILKKSTEKMDIPAIDLARRKRKNKPETLPAWSILKQAGRLPSWANFREAADETCMSCSLRDFASESTCRDCPAVQLTKKLLEAADERR